MTNPINNFVVIDSIHGKFIVNRHCDYQAESLIKSGLTHIENELKNMLAIVGTLPTGAVALDAGANIGFVSVPLANALRAKGGHVFAFEVQKMLYYALCGTVALNDIGNLTVFNKGLGKATGMISVPEQNYSAPSDFGTLSLVGQSFGDASLDSGHVRITRIDDLGVSRLDFLKIDVEGMEIDVLEGATDTIVRNRPWCWIEYHKVERSQLITFFSNREYTLFRMDTLNMLCAPNDKLAKSGLEINAQLFF